MIEIKLLSQISNQQILNCFNLSFSDYSIPFKLTLEQLETKINTENINKEFSVGVFRSQSLIGFVLHGDRKIGGKRKAYNAGTGVIPTERGQSLTKRMYGFIIPILEKNEFNKVELEVISNNVPAITSYEQIGFKPVRNLSCFNGTILIKAHNQKIKIRQVENASFEELNKIGEIIPTWQNSKETITNLDKKALYFLAYMEENLCGFVILNSINNRILQIAVKKEMRNMLIGSSLLKHIKDNISESISIINVDSNFNSTLHFLENRNVKKSITQEEMILQLIH